jgi:hypothetical protein
MNQGTQGYSLTIKTEGRKSRETVPLNVQIPLNMYDFYSGICQFWYAKIRYIYIYIHIDLIKKLQKNLI